jgi:hypothetical protein
MTKLSIRLQDFHLPSLSSCYEILHTTCRVVVDQTLTNIRVQILELNQHWPQGWVVAGAMQQAKAMQLQFEAAPDGVAVVL